MRLFVVEAIYREEQMRVGDLVARKWKPALGHGRVLHMLGDKACVKWWVDGRPFISFEHKKNLKAIL